jgi:hypothetical protein
VIANPAIAGLDLRVYWDDVEPGPGWFNWNIINTAFTEVQLYNNEHDTSKYVVLTVVPGFGTPAWALTGDVAWATFPRQYGPDTPAPGCLRCLGVQPT